MKHSPAHYAEALYDVLADAPQGDQKKVFSQFFTLLSKNHDTRLVPRILRLYEKIYLEKNGLKKIDVESALPISADVRRQIEQSAGASLLLTEAVNPSILAGMIITVNDTFRIDASVRNRIAKIFA